MILRKTPGRIVFEFFNTVIMLSIVFACLAPIIHVLLGSVSDPNELAKHEGIILKPLGFTVKGYELVFSNKNIITGYINTIFYVMAATSLGTFLTLLGGYAFSRKRLLWGNTMMFIVIFTMFFSGGLIPFYMVVKQMGMIGNRLSMIIPTALSAFNLIIMRTSMLEIPDSLEESAKIDGAGHFKILFKIIAPLSKASIAVVVLFYGVGHWNSWFNASIFLSGNRKLFPLQLVLNEILVQNQTGAYMSGSDVSGQTDLYKPLVKYCAIVVSTMPLICVYPFLQKYFVTGVMIGSIKG